MKYSNEEVKNKIIKLIDENNSSVRIKKVVTSKVEFHIEVTIGDTTTFILIKEYTVWINNISFEIEMLHILENMHNNRSIQKVENFLDLI